MSLWVIDGRLLIKRDDKDIHWVTIKGNHIPIKGRMPMDVRRKRVRRTLRKIENHIRHKKVEHGYIVNQEGYAVWNKVGKNDYIDVSDAVRKGLLKDNIFTHNHPRGLSISGQDVNTMINNRMKRIRAVSSTFDHEIYPPRGFDYSDESIDKFWNHYWDIYEEEEAKLLHMIHTHKITSEEADEQIDHNVWMRMSKDYDMRYKKVPVKDENQIRPRNSEHIRRRNRKAFFQNDRRRDKRKTKRTRKNIQGTQRKIGGISTPKRTVIPVLLIKKKKKDYDPEYQNPDGTFKDGFKGAVRYFMNVEGYSKEAATKIAGKIAAEKGDFRKSVWSTHYIDSLPDSSICHIFRY